MARPRKVIDWQEFKKLCQIHATQEEIAGWFECSVDTIERACKRDQKAGFAELYKQWSAGGKISVRRKQIEVALSGNPTMLIWVGKQMLGQTENAEPDSGLKDDALLELLARASAEAKCATAE